MFSGFVCASLGDQVDRRRTFARQFDDPAQFRFVPSIDGRAWTEDQARPFLSPAFFDFWMGAKAMGKRYISPGAIACTLTHRDRLFPAAEQGDHILCEDDVVIEHNFIRLWQDAANRALFRSVGANGPILLYYTEVKPITAQASAVGHVGPYGIYRMTSANIGSSACYYLHPDLATRLRSIQSPLVSICDDWRSLKPLAGYPDIHLVHPSPCRIAGHASTIGYGEGDLSQMNGAAIRMARSLKRALAVRRGKLCNSITRFE